MRERVTEENCLSFHWQFHFRYFGITSLTQSSVTSLNAARIEVGLAAVTSFCSAIPYWISFNLQSVTCNDKRKFIQIPSDFAGGTYHIVFNISIGVVFNVLPLCATLIATTLLVKFVMRQKQVRTSVLRENENTSQSRSLDNVTKVLISVALMYLVCLTPQGLSFLLSFLVKETAGCGIYRYFVSFADMLALFNSAMNFFIYLRLPAFKHILKKMFCRSSVVQSGPVNATVLEPRSGARSESDWM